MISWKKVIIAITVIIAIILAIMGFLFVSLVIIILLYFKTPMVPDDVKVEEDHLSEIKLDIVTREQNLNLINSVKDKIKKGFKVELNQENIIYDLYKTDVYHDSVKDIIDHCRVVKTNLLNGIERIYNHGYNASQGRSLIRRLKMFRDESKLVKDDKEIYEYVIFLLDKFQNHPNIRTAYPRNVD